MSTATKRLRRAGVGGVAAAVAFGSLSVMSPAFAAPGVSASSAPNVTQGATNQAAGDVAATFANNFTTNATETFTVGANDCSTQANIDKAIGFTKDPTVTLSGPVKAGGGAGDARKPSYTVQVQSSSAACTTAGIKDQVVVTLTQPSDGTATDEFTLTLGGVAYNVGKDAGTGNVTVTAAGVQAGNAINAKVVNKSYTFIPVIAAQLGSAGNTLGTATFTETTAGAYFGTGDTVVDLTLSAGTFTDGVTPTITVPTGYVVKGGVPATAGASNTYSFTITGPATLSKAVVSVAGLKLQAPNAAQTVSADAVVGGGAAETMPVANVLDYSGRSGGSDRYATAATVFNDGFGNRNDVVLSGGQLFPDALSANYLAGKLGTGTLLTKPTQLPAVTREALFSHNIRTVYITGGAGAVSESVANEIRSLHVNNNPNNAFISVVRLGGKDRYATNQIVNEFNFQTSNTVLLAAGTGFADALALGPIAYSSHYPLILTKGGTLGTTEQTQLNDFSPTNVVIAGGTGVVSQALEDSLRAKGYNVLRLGGADRTLTAAQIATWASVGVGDKTGLSAGPATMLNNNTVFVTNGLGFADALSAGPVAGDDGSVIMPTAGVTKLGAGLASYLGSKTVGNGGGDEVNSLYALGLTGAVSNSVMKDAAAAIGS